MDNDPIEQARGKHRMIGFSVIIALILILAVLYFFWGFLNRGTLSISGDEPFTVEIFGKDPIVCNISPCEITDKRGIKNLVIQKEGFKNILLETQIKLWRTLELKIEFEKLPTLMQTEGIPESSDKFDYEIVKDPSTHMYKLVKTDDPDERAIVYFPAAFENATIFGSKDYVLIVNDELYKVDVRLKERDRVDADFGEIDDGKWSLGGRYFIYSQKDSGNLWILDTQNYISYQSDLVTSIPQVSWIADDNLVFATRQGYSSNSAGEIKLLDEVTETSLTFGIFEAKSGAYFEIDTFEDINTLPDKMVTARNGRTIFFSANNIDYKIEM